MSTVDDPKGHLTGEATPQEIEVPAIPSPPPAFGLHDSEWTADQWLELLNKLVEFGIVNWKEITGLVLGHLNPSQVGTSLASSTGFKRRYGKGNTMRIVMGWIYNQAGRCVDCGTRLELQADHVQGREGFADPLDADFIENMTLRCRRCNVIRRPSHEFGGLTYLTAEAALMWILLVIRPRTFKDYVRMCRLYGMTMADIRMQEAWSMAHWLAKATPPAFGIEDDQNSQYDLVLWADSAITRVDPGIPLTEGSRLIYSDVPGNACLGFITMRHDGRLKFFQQSIDFIPFSTYDMGTRPPQSLAIHYTPPNRGDNEPQKLIGLPPRDMVLLTHAVKILGQRFQLVADDDSVAPQDLPKANHLGRLINTRCAPQKCRLRSSIDHPTE